MQFLSLLTTLFNTLGKDKVNQLIPLLTALLKAAKAKDWTTVLLTVMQIIEIVTGGKVTPKPPVPGPGPVFASASDEGQFVSECVAAGGDSLDAQELVDELK